MAQKIALPGFAERLVKAQNKYDTDAFAAEFTSDAVVHDEGKVYRGIAQIKAWNEGTNEKYHITLEPTSFESDKNKAILTATMTGNFGGSPASVKYNVTVKEGQIE